MQKEDIPTLYLVLTIILIIITGILAKNKGTWAGESFLIITAIVFLVATYKRFQFSLLSYTFMFMYLLLPLIGGCFGYPTIEMGIIDNILDPTRHNFDRVVHFLSGLLLTLPIQEILRKKAKVKSSWIGILSVAIILAAGGLYEIMEWIGVYIFPDPNFAETFLGIQGDFWDAQKDMIMATLGSILVVLIQAFRRKNRK